MKKVLKWLGIIILVIVVLIISGIGYIKFAKPDVGEAQAIKIEVTP